MSLYYDRMALYTEQVLFGVSFFFPSSLLKLCSFFLFPPPPFTSSLQLTVVGMKHSDERVEFWSTVCEEVVDLAIEAQEVRPFVPSFSP